MFISWSVNETVLKKAKVNCRESYEKHKISNERDCGREWYRRLFDIVGLRVWWYLSADLKGLSTQERGEIKSKWPLQQKNCQPAKGHER